MRFKSAIVGGYQVYAVACINTVSFAIDASGADTAGLLGFAVERADPAGNEHYYMYGFKVFPSVIPEPDDGTVVTTYDHPVQSFVWDDFTAKDDHVYDYTFHPLKGQPKNLDRGAAPITIRIRTEKLVTTGTHDVFFNRGVASSQAYARKYKNKSPDKQPTAAKRIEALQWLSRDLDEALLRFIDATPAGDALLACFYEFRWRPAADALKAAIDRGVAVSLIVDAKVNETTDKDGVFHESFPRKENLEMIADAGIPDAAVTKRVAKPNDIQHNKFMVRLAGAARTPTEVWTGSTNLSEGGLYGQTNVGHWVRDPATAAAFQAYWQLLKGDPGGQAGDDTPTTKAKNLAHRKAVEALGPVPTDFASVAAGITTIFSPRRGPAVLDFYAALVDQADRQAAITLAFGISKAFKDRMADNTPQSAIAFFLLEKEDKPNPNSTQPFVAINASQNCYKAWGSYLKEPLYRWTKETNARALELNQHVSYIHSKFLLKDPLSADPIVVTGSANFSPPSTNDNDENMLVIRGDLRVADIYFTEFNRLFNHYYFRSVTEATKRRLAAANGGVAPASDPNAEANLFLGENDDWLAKYEPGKFRAKRVRMLTTMSGFSSP
jgi:phosphatidylserine/phosphatidylglycerophosphate/cardiolipin synthase-like enzyme